MGVTVRQKKKGRGQPWYVFIHRDGLIRSKKVGDRPTAQALAKNLRMKLLAGQLNLDVDVAPEFAQYARHYIEDYAKTTCKRTTWRGYEVMVEKHILPAWRGRKLTEIKRADVKKLLLAKQRDDLSPKSVQNLRALISGIFTFAFEEELIDTNPAHSLGRCIKKIDRRKHVRPLTKEQASKFLLTARHEYPETYPFWLCLFRTGMRLGEVVGLAWKDIDFDTNMITVQRSYTHGGFSTPKSNKSRIVDLSDQLKHTLLSHRMDLMRRFGGDIPKLRVGSETIHLVFPNAEGKATDSDNLRARVFRRITEKAGLPRFRIHDIRHTFASLLLQQGEPLNYVKEQLGHASIQTTVDVYGHIVPGSNRKAVNQLDDEGDFGLRAVSEAG